MLAVAILGSKPSFKSAGLVPFCSPLEDAFGVDPKRTYASRQTRMSDPGGRLSSRRCTIVAAVEGRADLAGRIGINVVDAPRL